MATGNPFDLLVDDDTDDVSQLIAKKSVLAPTTTTTPTSVTPTQQQPKQGKLPSKPVPPTQAGETIIFISLLWD
ncbi:hypothetical protein GIB67_012458 [Kingdonia uniflora]|uniref:STM1-like N-terminal domain-containing protein n=1 Tax=Kingdonia uniflora TaxID=39325 RepID=A0A7J7MV82_9MAGN|nr:hypothetical protein GIB67_012458 [Kingdonia uniflora]